MELRNGPASHFAQDPSYLVERQQLAGEKRIKKKRLKRLSRRPLGSDK
jgi:hypothetical protein